MFLYLLWWLWAAHLPINWPTLLHVLPNIFLDSCFNRISKFQFPFSLSSCFLLSKTISELFCQKFEVLRTSDASVFAVRLPVLVQAGSHRSREHMTKLIVFELIFAFRFRFPPPGCSSRGGTLALCGRSRGTLAPFVARQRRHARHTLALFGRRRGTVLVAATPLLRRSKRGRVRRWGSRVGGAAAVRGRPGPAMSFRAART